MVNLLNSTLKALQPQHTPLIIPSQLNFFFFYHVAIPHHHINVLWFHLAFILSFQNIVQLLLHICWDSFTKHSYIIYNFFLHNTFSHPWYLSTPPLLFSNQTKRKKNKFPFFWGYFVVVVVVVIVDDFYAYYNVCMLESYTKSMNLRIFLFGVFVIKYICVCVCVCES